MLENNIMRLCRSARSRQCKRRLLPQTLSVQFAIVALVLATLCLNVSMLSPAAARIDPIDDEALQFLHVLPNAKLGAFEKNSDGTWSMTFSAEKGTDSADKAYSIASVLLFREKTSAAAEDICKRQLEWSRQAYREQGVLEGFPCSSRFMCSPPVCGTAMRTTIVSSGVYDAMITESGKGLSDESALAKLLALLRGKQPLSPGEVAFRNVLFRTGLKFGGDAARSCLDEVMNMAGAAAAKDAKMADEIAQLRKAAARAHAVEVLAALPVGPEYFDDFDPKWWEAVKEVTPSPFAPADPRDTSTDVAVEWLPPALKWLINITRAADKGMRAIKKHVVDRAMQGELFACYRTIRPSYPAVISRASAEAYEEQLSHILFDVVGSCHSAGAAGFQAGYGKVSNEEFRRLSRPVAVRFEVIYQIEDARNHRDARIDEHWAPVQDILARLKARVNTCIADRASRSR